MTEFSHRGLILFVCISVVSACATQNTKETDPNVYLGVCKARLHPEKSNPTADYQACKFNNDKNSELVSECMLTHGWSELTEVPCDEATEVFASSEINHCIEKSKSDGVVSHPKMNDCLSEFKPKRSDAKKTEKLLRDILGKFGS